MEDSELINLIAKLSLEDTKRYEDAVLEGYKNEKCPKCGTWFLAFHHLVMCQHASCGECPMVTNPKSLLKQMLEEMEKEDVANEI